MPKPLVSTDYSRDWPEQGLAQLQSQLVGDLWGSFAAQLFRTETILKAPEHLSRRIHQLLQVTLKPGAASNISASACIHLRFWLCLSTSMSSLVSQSHTCLACNRTGATTQHQLPIVAYDDA